MNLTTPQEVFAHIISIYEKCETLDEIDEISNNFICTAIGFLKISRKLKDDCTTIVMANYNLVDSDLIHGFKFLLLSPGRARREHRQKEYIQIKIDYLNKLIELCDKDQI